MPSSGNPTGPKRRSVKSPPSSIPPSSSRSGGSTRSTGSSSKAAPSKAAPSKAAPSAKAGAGAKKSTKADKPGFWNYPRKGKGPIRRWLPSWRFILGSTLTVIALGVGAFAYLYATTEVPDPEDVALAETSTVYFGDGTTEMGTFAEINRVMIDAGTLPDHVGHAVVASEDRRFYSNSGIDPIGIARAFWNNLTGGSTQGGSTITQQYVERYYTGQTSGYADKLREVFLALKIDREQSKDEILGNYLNTIYYGRGAYGIETAAQAYFDKPAAELTLSESAMIAGIIPAPSNYDPAVNPEMAQQRWSRTLAFMVEAGFITQAEADQQVFPDVVDYSPSNSLGGTNGYLLDMVRAEALERSGLTEDQIYGGGLTIEATVDPQLQQLAVEAAQGLPDDAPENLRVALVSMDPTTGAILSLYGGDDFVTQSRNNATQDRAQGGSTFKPFTLIAALEDDIPLEQRFASYTPMDIDDYTVRNFDSRNRGNIDLVAATVDSVNTVYVQLNDEVGPERTVDVATRLGLPESTPGLDPYLSNVLGPASPTALDMVTAYSTIADGGERHESFIVSEIRDGNGNVLYTGEQPGEQEFDAQVIADATYAMTQVVERGTGRTASELNRPVAGKTGSSQDYRSAWFVGFVPQMTTAVALYQPGEDGTEEELTPFGGANPVAGGTWPTTIWTNYMTGAVADLPVEDFPERSEPRWPTPQPTEAPTWQPTQEPTQEPTTVEPTEEPTTVEPTEEPTEEPTDDPGPTTPPDPGPDPPEEDEG